MTETDPLRQRIYEAEVKVARLERNLLEILDTLSLVAEALSRMTDKVEKQIRGEIKG
jgi:archaellum component FlaC